ncbi:unnamed protein product [Caenorhabditis brenneri]
MLRAAFTWDGQGPPNPEANEGLCPIPPAWMDHVLTSTISQAAHYQAPHLGIPSYVRLDEIHPTWLQPVRQATYIPPVVYGVPHNGVPSNQYLPMGHVLQTPESYGIYSFLPNPYVALQPTAHSQGYGGNYGTPSPYHHVPLYNLGEHIPTPPTPITSAPRRFSRKPKAPKLKNRKEKFRKIKAEPKTFEAVNGKIKKEVE